MINYNFYFFFWNVIPIYCNNLGKNSNDLKRAHFGLLKIFNSKGKSMLANVTASFFGVSQTFVNVFESKDALTSPLAYSPCLAQDLIPSPKGYNVTITFHYFKSSKTNFISNFQHQTSQYYECRSFQKKMLC
jgi:hypothetical protein